MTHDEFRAIRKTLGLTVRGLADKLHIKSERTVRRWEQPPSQLGHRTVPPHIIRTMRRLEQNHKRKENQTCTL